MWSGPSSRGEADSLGLVCVIRLSICCVSCGAESVVVLSGIVIALVRLAAVMLVRWFSRRSFALSRCRLPELWFELCLCRSDYECRLP